LCPGVPVGTPILNQTTINLSNSRYQGFELALKRAPPTGWGFSVSGALQKSYVYNLPPGFYCSVPLSVTPCTPSTYDQNLNVIAGENFNGGTDSFDGASSIVNTSIPYLQGDANLSYTFRDGVYALFGETLYGKNNSLNEPPFGIAYLTVRVPLTSTLAFQVSGDNVFNAWPETIPNYVGGVPITLVTGQKAATTGNVLGPATYRFLITQRLP
jgi:hypothetical protein